MVQELNYNTISLVIESWEQLRRVENYELVAGTKLFSRLFDKCPHAKVLFGFPLDIDPNCPQVMASKRFIMHASYMIQMLDTALNMLGPDIDLLTDIMTELGTKHIRYGVKPDMFPVMGECLVSTLQDTLKENMSGASLITPEVKAAWIETYKALSTDMLQGMKSK